MTRRALLLLAAAAFVMVEAVQLTVEATTPHAASGASLSLIGPTFAGRDRAMMFTAMVQRAGVPAYIRTDSGSSRFQVLVGPYVSSDEAAAAQAMLAKRGIPDTRLFVDDTIRREASAPLVSFGADRPSTQPSVLVAAAPGMVTVAFELAGAPREVMSQRSAPTLLEVDVEPIGHAEAERWMAPEGTLLLKAIAFEPPPVAGTRGRFRLTVPAEAQSRVRLEGRRVYVDLAWPDAPWVISIVRQPDAGSRSPSASAPQSMSHPGQDVESQVQEVVARFRQIEPFLLAAVETPDSQVLGALAATLTDLERQVPSGSPGAAALRKAVATAGAAAAPEFEGDRVMAVRQAMAEIDALR